METKDEYHWMILIWGWFFVINATL